MGGSVSLRRAVGDAWRRAVGAGTTYDWSTFCDRPVEQLALTSLFAERPAGGWRAYAGTAMERKWSDIFTIDVFLADQRPSLIVELGTGTGAFSCYLATYAYLNGARFCTFDSHLKSVPTKRSNERAMRLIRKLGGEMHRRDIFHSATQRFIRRLIQRGPRAFLYCDNGNKAREVQTFVGDLKDGDFIGVHDYGSEIHESDLAPFVGTTLRPWNATFFEGLQSSNRIYQKTNDAQR